MRDDPMSPRPPSGGLTGTRDLLHRHPGLWPALGVSLSWLLAVYFLAALGFLAAVAGGQAAPAALAAAPIAYYVLVSAGALAYYRLRLPLVPAVFLLAGRGWAALGRRQR